VRERFWPGRRFRDLLDLNVQAARWRDDFANGRIHETTGKVPALVFEHDERRFLKPAGDRAFDADDRDTYTVTKTFRVRFDRNLYSVPWRLVGQTVLVRASDETVAVYLGPKQVARHRRSWGAGEDLEDPAHRHGLMEHKPRAAAGRTPPQLAGLEPSGARYLKLLGASSRSLHREVTRLTFLVEVFGETATRSAVDEVMATGHVGAEYVEYVLRHKKGLTPSAAPLKLGDPALDGIAFREPDLSLYDQLVSPQKTLDPGEPPEENNP